MLLAISLQALSDTRKHSKGVVKDRGKKPNSKSNTSLYMNDKLIHIFSEGSN